MVRADISTLAKETLTAGQTVITPETRNTFLSNSEDRTLALPGRDGCLKYIENSSDGDIKVSYEELNNEASNEKTLVPGDWQELIFSKKESGTDEWFIINSENKEPTDFFNLKMPQGSAEFITGDPISLNSFSTSLDSAGTYNLSDGSITGQMKKLITTTGSITVNLSLTGFTSISLGNNNRAEMVWSVPDQSWVLYDEKGLTRNV